MQSPVKKKTLFFREWVAIVVVLGFFIIFVLIHKLGEVHSKRIVDSQIAPSEMMIEIHLIGAVNKPGVYVCRAGTVLGKVVKEAGISENANKKKIPFKKVLFSSQTVEIPQKKRIRVQKRTHKKISLEGN